MTFGEGASVVVMDERKRLGEGQPALGEPVALIGCGTRQAQVSPISELQRLRLADGGLEGWGDLASKVSPLLSFILHPLNGVGDGHRV